MKERLVNFSFLAHGSVVQDIKITADDISGEQLVDMLKAGEAATTIHEDGDVVAIPSFETIGTVVYSDTDLDYTGFQIEGGEIESENALQPFNASRMALQSAVGEFIYMDDDPEEELSAAEVLDIIKDAADNGKKLTSLVVEERYVHLTPNELLFEIHAFRAGLFNLMTLAHFEGKRGKEII